MARVRVANDKGLVALLVAVILMCGGGLAVTPAAAETLVPAVYVFGDETVDVGNSGPLPLPYGIDLPQDSMPTGRVSNGYNMADSFSRLLGFEESPPAYQSLTPEMSPEILRGFGGVNYASAGSGILDTTRMVNHSRSMAEQVEFFEATKSKMIESAGDEGSVAIDTLLSKSLFLINAGSNDLFDLLQKPEMLPYVQPTFSRLKSEFKTHVQTLYDLGARRFGVINVPPIGCVPSIRAKMDGGCRTSDNIIASELNKLVRERMKFLKIYYYEVEYSVGSSYNLVFNFTYDPKAAGFKDVASACCGDGRFGVETLCGQPNSKVCQNRADYLYWDSLHTTEATANKAAAIIFSAPVEERFASPINFKQLVSSTDGFGGFSSS